MEGPFTFETLSAQEAREKKERSLTKIESRFFRYVANYLEQLEDAQRKEQEKNPSSKRAAFLSDELRNATNKAEELWKAREKKIVTFAQLAARRDPTPAPPVELTREEAAFYQSLVELLKMQWLRLLPQRAGAPWPQPAAAAGAAPNAPVGEAAPAAAPTPAPVATAAPETVQTIRALMDIPPFVGFDGKTYRIRKGEVMALPRKFAEILKQRNQVSYVG